MLNAECLTGHRSAFIVRHCQKGVAVAKFAVILPAAGRSSRFRDKSYKKPFAPLANKAIWLHSAERFLGRDDVLQTILVIAPEDRDQFNFKFSANIAILGIEVIDGGAAAGRLGRGGLGPGQAGGRLHLRPRRRPALPLRRLDRRDFRRRREDRRRHLRHSLGRHAEAGRRRHKIEETVSRENLWEAQTPQVFRRQLLLDAYAKRGGFPATDDAQLVERLGHPVTVVPGSPINMKITTKEDQRLAEQALKALPKPKLPGPLHPFATMTVEVDGNCLRSR